MSGLLLVTGYHWTSSPCVLDFEVEGSRCAPLRKPSASAWVTGQYPSPHTNQMTNYGIYIWRLLYQCLFK